MFSRTAPGPPFGMLIVWGLANVIWAPEPVRLSVSLNPVKGLCVSVPGFMVIATPLKLNEPSGFWMGTSLKYTSIMGLAGCGGPQMVPLLRANISFAVWTVRMSVAPTGPTMGIEGFGER